MSNKVKSIRKNVEAKRKLEEYTLYGSLIGSIIVTLGKLVEKNEQEMLEDFAYYSKDEDLFKCKNVREVVEYIKRDYGVIEDYEDALVLVYDENNLYTPAVTLEVNGNILPLDRNGTRLGILSHLGEEGIYVEYIFAEDSIIED